MLNSWKKLELVSIKWLVTYPVFVFKSAGDTWTETLAYVLFWELQASEHFFVIPHNGKDFVDAPRLVQKEKID